MSDNTSTMDRNLALEAVRVTEAAALSASRWMGRGDEKAATALKLTRVLELLMPRPKYGDPSVWG